MLEDVGTIVERNVEPSTEVKLVSCKETLECELEIVNGKQKYPMKKCFCSNSYKEEKKKMKRRLRTKEKLVYNEEFCLVNGGLWGLEEEDV